MTDEMAKNTAVALMRMGDKVPDNCCPRTELLEWRGATIVDANTIQGHARVKHRHGAMDGFFLFQKQLDGGWALTRVHFGRRSLVSSWWQERVYLRVITDGQSGRENPNERDSNLTKEIVPGSEPQDLRTFCAKVGTHPGPGLDGTKNRQVLESGHNTWRCMHGKVYACYLGASGRACMQNEVAPTKRRLAEFRKYCRQSPNSDYIPNYLSSGLASAWGCSGTKPVILDRYKVDSQGYFSEAWKLMK